MLCANVWPLVGKNVEIVDVVAPVSVDEVVNESGDKHGLNWSVIK